MRQKTTALSPRERAVVDLFAQGVQRKIIADRLSMSVKTVAGNLERACIKMGAKNPKDLLFMTAKSGGTCVVGRVWNVNEGLPEPALWVAVSKNTPSFATRYLVVADRDEVAA